MLLKREQIKTFSVYFVEHDREHEEEYEEGKKIIISSREFE
jgi:hypothetical protein